MIQDGSCGTFIDLARTKPMALRRNERGEQTCHARHRNSANPRAVVAIGVVEGMVE